LKQVLGADVSQAGSSVDFERLRFDFNSSVAPTEAQLARVEELINGWIGEAVAVQTTTMGLTEARAVGAVAMFGEKYGDVVRVVDVPGVSMELCGGTHVANTAEIGAIKVRAGQTAPQLDPS
jgi:alanyl-tRNA synthetase